MLGRFLNYYEETDKVKTETTTVKSGTWGNGMKISKDLVLVLKENVKDQEKDKATTKPMVSVAPAN
jgi:hypothetical protein